MSDPELEDLLRRYRPAGPPPDLRARIVAGPAPVPRTWPWAADLVRAFSRLDALPLRC